VAAKEKLLAGRALYGLASAYALAAGCAEKDTKLPQADREKQAARNAGLAVEMLGRARSGGYFQTRTLVKRLKQDSDFAPLHGREDFKKLLDELEVVTRCRRQLVEMLGGLGDAIPVVRLADVAA
jgi:hypothetical protein